tara:strand:+ start:276 stop:1412 length:1137 start_codon:yes stop_codon:yes gene_type:complete
LYHLIFIVKIKKIMAICLIGKNLTTLVLSKVLINKGLNVDLYYKNNKLSKNLSKTSSRTIGLSNESINFLVDQKILNKKKCWDIKQINLYKGNESKSFLNFKSKSNNFYMTSYNDFFNSLEKRLKKNQLIKFKNIKNKKFYLKLNKKRYEIIINTDTKNPLFKKYFSNFLSKNYDSIAFTTIIKHSKIEKNNIAEQFFTKYGPLAFLPISKTKTSIVFSIFDKNLKKNRGKIKELIMNYNRRYQIKNITDLLEFPINLSLSRNYYYKNVLSFGDALHKIHPLAGQGFNMTLRDTKIISNLIEKNLKLGLNFDNVLEKFENKRKSSNLVFAMSIDFIHEFFKLLNNYNLKSIDKFFSLMNNSKYIKNKLENFANKGINF